MTHAEKFHYADLGSDAAPPTEPARRSLAELESQITELAGHLNAASFRWLELIAEFDRREGWADGSTPSCAHWLGWKCGIDAGAAREKVRVARALEGLPMISAAMARGALSYSKVRALTRVATVETEDMLLMIALHGTAHHVETLVRRYRRAQEACELGREALQYVNRAVNWFYDDDGSLVLRARLTAETGALLVKALELASDEPRCEPASPDVPAETSDGCNVPDSDSSKSSESSMWSKSSKSSNSKSSNSCDLRDFVGPDSSNPQDSTYVPSTLSQRRADALALFAETWLSNGYQALGGGERQQIVVHVDGETLRENTPGRCEIAGGASIAAQTARRLSCDASLVTLVEDESGRPLDIGRRTRTIPPAIRRALRARDDGCRFPGCTHTHFLDGHHIRHWANGGETKLSNLVMLCRFHHRQVHEGQVDVRLLDDGALRFINANGKRLEAAQSMLGDTAKLLCEHRRVGIAIAPTTAVTGWCGELIDYPMAVEGLLFQQGRAGRDVAAGTSDGSS